MTTVEWNKLSHETQQARMRAAFAADVHIKLDDQRYSVVTDAFDIPYALERLEDQVRYNA